MSDVKELKIEEDATSCPNVYNRSKSETPEVTKPQPVVVVKKKLRAEPSRNIYVAQKKYYGPKATLQDVKDEYKMLVQDPMSMHLKWKQTPTNIFVLKKNEDSVFQAFNKLVNYLTSQKLVVYVEEKDYNNELFQVEGKEECSKIRKFYTSLSSLSNLDKCSNTNPDSINEVDLIITLGGDGTILYASTLFQQSCPPVLAMNMGSLGFLCPFNYEEHPKYIKSVLSAEAKVPILLRNRLQCTFEKVPVDGSANTSVDSIIPEQVPEDASIRDYSQPSISLNEIVVGRGPSPFLSNLDLWINDLEITTVQGDGIIISTPTGSTAYAMAAGASMSHPSVPSIIIAPICPHSLSFRPIVVPATVELKIRLAKDARHTAWFCVDGRANTELKHGYQIKITTSEYPLPSICANDQLNDWFEGLAVCLHWNDRRKQLPLNNCYLDKSKNGTVPQSGVKASTSAEAGSTNSK